MTKSAKLASHRGPKRGNQGPAAAEGSRKYESVRAEAQRKANQTGFDHALEANDLFHEFVVTMLPRKENRSVSCEIAAKCQVGHGP